MMLRFWHSTAVLLAIASGACASSGAIPRPFPGATTVPESAVSTPGSAEPDETGVAIADPDSAPSLARVVETALQFRGVPYRNGGTDPSGFDCSGFVQYVFAQHGTALPREVREQFEFGEEIEMRRLRAGDLIFFTTVARGP